MPVPLEERLRAALAPDYELVRRLGRGGMAWVFLARETSLKRMVAIKVLDPDLSSPVFRTRFEREAETAAQLQHPNIVPIFRVGEADGLAWYAMGLVEGESLAERLRREQRLGIDEALRIGREVAAALAAAHRRGIVHRDVKPQNIMLEAESGRTLVTDFGIARVVTGGGEPVEDDRLTGLGMVMGTPHYMSPEQAAGDRDLTPASDVYALGIVLYEMLTGAYPYQVDSEMHAIRAHLTQAPQPVTERVSGLPPAVPPLLDRLLDKNPELRPASTEVAVALGGEGGGTPSGARPAVRRRPRNSRMLFGAAGLLLALVVAGSFLWKRGSTGPPPGVDPRKSLLIGYFENTSQTPELAWLRLGGVDLLAQALRRWQDLQVVEVERLLDLARRAGVEGEDRLSLDDALSMARSAGVWTATVGSIVPVRGVLRVSVSVYDVASGRLLTTATAQAADSNLTAAFDTLGRDILNLADVPPGALVDVEPPTRSLEAYHAYIDGITARSHWDLDSAATYFRRAISLDPGFALAYYELSQAVFIQELLSPDPSFVALSDSALRYAQGRPPRERQLIEANNALVHADFPRARALYAQLIARDSTLADAWVGQGVASLLDLTLRKDRRGRDSLPADLTLARRSYERALELDASDHRVYGNLASVLSLAGREDEAELPGYRSPPPGAINTVNNRLPERMYAVLLIGGDSLITVPADSLYRRYSHATVDSLRREARRQAREVADQWIRVAPDEGQALVLRAELNRLDKNYDAALRDLARADSLGATTVVPFSMQRLRLMLMARRTDAALAYADTLERSGVGERLARAAPITLGPLINTRLIHGRVEKARQLMTPYFSQAQSLTADSQVTRFLRLAQEWFPVRFRANMDLATPEDIRGLSRALAREAPDTSGLAAQIDRSLAAVIMLASATIGDTATTARWAPRSRSRLRAPLLAFASAQAGDRDGAARYLAEASTDS
ncbi:MAG: protein kinase, partial [Gemmatimonadales bacterium]